MANPTTIAAYPLSPTRNYQIPFEYLARRFIVVTLVGLTSRVTLAAGEGYRFTDATHIETTYTWSATDGFDYIEIKRYTSATDRLVDFNDGSILRANDLNVSQIQSLHIAEEGRDALDDRLGISIDNQLDARNRRIIRLAPGIAPTDAVNVNQLRGTEAAAERSRVAAEDAARRAALAVGSVNAVAGSYLTPRVPPYNALGDGVTNDSAAFAAFEVDHKVRTVDLGAGTYLVNSIPTGNIYINGSFKLAGGAAGFTRPAFEGDKIVSRPATYSPYGGQLSRMKADLMNPLCQYVGIVFLGDSITWGSGNQPETLPTEPRNGTLRDPRDYFDTASYVNNVRRYLLDEYAEGAGMYKLGWHESPWGEPIVVAEKKQWMLPTSSDFATSIVGSTITVAELDSPGTPVKKRMNVTNSNASDPTGTTTYVDINFTFTGNSFGLLLGCVAGNAAVYDIYVNNVLNGTFTTEVGSISDDGLGMVNNENKERTHNIGYYRNAVVKIRCRRPANHVGASVWRCAGMFINKTLRLTNNGINGATFESYRVYNMPPGGVPTSGSVAVNDGDLYAFIQFGSNDRITTRHAQTTRAVSDACGRFLDSIPGYCAPILMCAGPAANVAGANLTMEDIRASIHNVARSRAIDFIDNYALFRGITKSAWANDQLHPQQWGHTVMSTNIIKSIEAAMDISVKPLPPPVPTVWSFPWDPRVSWAGTAEVVDRDAVGAILGKQRAIRYYNATLFREATLKVNNCDEIAIAFSSAAERCMSYSLTVDGVFKGNFVTAYLAPGGGTQTYANTRWHALPEGGTHTVVFKWLWDAGAPAGTQAGYVEGFGVRETASIIQA